MTQMNLGTLSKRIKAHKTALVHIVKPPVCTEHAQHYTKCTRGIWINRFRYTVRWRWPVN